MYFDEEQLPHTDLTREWSLLYNVFTGGDDVELCFWQEPGHPIHRTDGYKTWPSTDGLELLECVKGPLHRDVCPYNAGSYVEADKGRLI